jgi:hypothetical protein
MNDSCNILPPPFIPFGHPLLAGIHSKLSPPDLKEETLPSVAASIHAMAITWDRVKEATASDNNMEKLLSIIATGFPAFRHQLPSDLQEYYQFRDHLHTVDGVYPAQRTHCDTTLTSTSCIIHTSLSPPRFSHP